jgi:hypothetical protein
MHDEPTVIEVGELFTELGYQLRQNATVVLVALVLLVGGNIAIDQLGKSTAAIAGFLSTAVQLYVLRAALDRAELLPANSKARLWRFWWMSLISALAIMAGCVLLIVPGLYLAARWFLAGPIVIAEDETTATEALRKSWDLTRDSAWHFAGATLILFGGGLAVAILPSVLVPETARGVFVHAATYVVMFGAYVCGWLMEVGAYARLTNSTHSLAEVFA